MNHPIQWGIWGTGTVAGQLAGDCRLADGAVVRAVASRSEDHARQFAAQHRIECWYRGLDSLLNDPVIDAVYVASPNHRHLPDSLAVLRAGKGVLCEKPFALNLAEAREIVAAARRQNVFCMEAMWTRFLPATIEAKRAIERGAIGAIRRVHANFAYPVLATPGSRLFDPASGGGALLDRGVYLVSLVQHLLGEPSAIRGSASIGPTGIDEQSAYRLEYAGGAVADLVASFRVRGSNELMIYGELGCLRLCDPFYRSRRLVLRSGRRSPPAAPQLTSAVAAIAPRNPILQSLSRRLGPVIDLLRPGRAQSFPFPGHGYQFELTEASRCLREQRSESPIMPLEDSLAVMQTLDTLRAQWDPLFPGEHSLPGRTPQ